MNPLRFLLFPFSVLYGLITGLRNYFYDRGFFKSTNFELPVIGVGNLRVGGTGKTPLIEYLIELLAPDHKVCTLSRGYGRKTSGFRLAKDLDNARTIGDEPYQIFSKFRKNASVAVGEDRILAIPEILTRLPETQVLLLDDIFQHRSVRSRLNILLTEYSRPFFYDHLLPMGRLREPRSGAGRADLIVVTKCPGTMDNSQMEAFVNELKPYVSDDLPVFFSRIDYLDPVQFGGTIVEPKEVLLVTGIANSRPIAHYVGTRLTLLEHVEFTDHHAYTRADIQRMVGQLGTYNSGEKAILTTEKDMIRMIDDDLTLTWGVVPRFYLPIKSKFLQDNHRFDAIVRQAVGI